MLECHHSSPEAYELDRRNKLTLNDVVILCIDCHVAVTDVLRRRRYESRDLERFLVYASYCSPHRKDAIGPAQQPVRGPKEPIKESNFRDNVQGKAENRRRFGGDYPTGVCCGIVPGPSVGSSGASSEHSQDANRSSS